MLHSGAAAVRPLGHPRAYGRARGTSMRRACRARAGGGRRTGELEVEVEDRHDAENPADGFRPGHFGLHEQGQHLHVVDADGDKGQVDLLAVEVVPDSGQRHRGGHHAHHDEPRVVGTPNAFAGQPVVELGALAAANARVARTARVVARARVQGFARQQVRAPRAQGWVVVFGGAPRAGDHERLVPPPQVGERHAHVVAVTHTALRARHAVLARIPIIACVGHAQRSNVSEPPWAGSAAPATHLACTRSQTSG